jgi:hypothetical protein
MVMNGLQNGLLTSRKSPRAPRLNCQKKIFKCQHILLFSNSDRAFYCETTMYEMLRFFSNKKKVKKITLHFETNDG